MKNLLGLLVISLYSGVATCDENSIAVVANIQDSSIKLSRQQVRNLFMGSSLQYDLQAVALPPANQTRVIFNTKVVGLTESRIQSYWAQMRFSGRKKPPVELKSEAILVKYLQNNPNSVGYLPADAVVPDGLTVIFQSQ